MAIGPQRILNRHYQGYDDFGTEQKIVFQAMEIERVVDSHIVSENYKTLAFFNKDRLDFEWPLIDACIKDGMTVYYMPLPMKNFDHFNNVERNNVYKILRKRYQKEDWINIYFEYAGGYLDVALVHKG